MTVTTTTTTLRPTKIISSVKLVTLVSSTEKTPTYALPQSSVDFQMATFSKTPIQLSLSTTLPATTIAHITIPTTTTTKRTTTVVAKTTKPMTTITTTTTTTTTTMSATVTTTTTTTTVKITSTTTVPIAISSIQTGLPTRSSIQLPIKGITLTEIETAPTTITNTTPASTVAATTTTQTVTTTSTTAIITSTTTTTTTTTATTTMKITPTTAVPIEISSIQTGFPTASIPTRSSIPLPMPIRGITLSGSRIKTAETTTGEPNTVSGSELLGKRSSLPFFV